MFGHSPDTACMISQPGRKTERLDARAMEGSRA